jgi:hypothetical protein
MTNVATPVGGTKQDTLVTVSVNGQTLGVFDTYSGGDVMAPSTKYRQGGQKNEQSFATQAKYSDMKVGRVLKLNVDWETVRGLKQQAGRVTCQATVQPLDADRNAYGSPQTATGLFLGVAGIDGDSNSEAIQDWTLSLSVDQWV